MYSDFFDQLGGGGGSMGGAGSRNRANAANEPAAADTPAPLVQFKAGKMELSDPDEGSTARYKCVADEKRGEIRLVWKDNSLKWQWYDRRNKSVANSWTVQDFKGSTFERVELTGKQHAQDRIYVWSRDPGTSSYEMYWMQDANPDKDDEYVAKVNQYLADPASAAPPAAMDTAADAGGAGATSGGAVAADGTNQSQVDALSSILENLQTGGGGTGAAAGGDAPASGTAAAGSSASGGGDASSGQQGTLTLADLQGAMAGIQQQQASSAGGASVGPPLQEVVTPGAISNLLENKAARDRLLELLPEEQRSEQYLEENLRSPQVAQTLRMLTSALVPDDAGNMDGFYSVLANFSLDPADGQDALTRQNNPIQAFLDCVLAQVEKEKKEEKKEGEEGGGDDGDDKKDDDGDARMEDNNEEEEETKQQDGGGGDGDKNE